jgi:Ca2+-binding RTX toxin-like protein
MLLAVTLLATALFVGPARAALIEGTNGNDTLKGTAKWDEIFGFAGRDEIRAYAGDDALRGGDGADNLIAGIGEDIVRGGDGNDVIDAQNDDRDLIFCGPGDFDVAQIDAFLDDVDDCEFVGGVGDPNRLASRGESAATK